MSTSNDDDAVVTATRASRADRRAAAGEESQNGRRRPLRARGEPPIHHLAEQKSLTARVRESLRDAIVMGQLEPGALYSVQTLADMFGVSRTPVREALIELARLEMVRFERNRGVRVLEASPGDIEEIFKLRLLLEVPAAYHAVTQIGAGQLKELRGELAATQELADSDDEARFMQHDRRFHSIIMAATHNTRLVDYVETLRDIVLTHGATTAGRTRSLMAIVDEHREILRRIEARDAPGTAEAMRSHILKTGSLLIEQDGGNGSILEPWAPLYPHPRVDGSTRFSGRAEMS